MRPTRLAVSAVCHRPARYAIMLSDFNLIKSQVLALNGLTASFFAPICGLRQCCHSHCCCQSGAPGAAVSTVLQIYSLQGAMGLLQLLPEASNIHPVEGLHVPG